MNNEFEELSKKIEKSMKLSENLCYSALMLSIAAFIASIGGMILKKDLAIYAGFACMLIGVALLIIEKFIELKTDFLLAKQEIVILQDEIKLQNMIADLNQRAEVEVNKAVKILEDAEALYYETAELLNVHTKPALTIIEGKKK